MEPELETAETLGVAAPELLAALGYLTDVTPGGCHCSSWRVALVSARIASEFSPETERDVFHAALLHDIGAVGASRHISAYTTMREQVEDDYIRSHSQRGAALVNWLPGMAAVAQYVTSHHEWWDGRGYPDGKTASCIPSGAMIVGMATTANMLGCFRSASNLNSCLASLSGLSGAAWSEDLWSAFLKSTEDGEFYKRLADNTALRESISAKVRELGVPAELDGPGGAERLLHLFAALVDLKDPSTAGHSLRTAQRAKTLAQFMGLPDQEAHLAYRAGLVHDCGRLGISTPLLNKRGRLSETEMENVRAHARMTIDVLSCLSDCPGMAKLGQLAGHDHERFDGSGYPDQLAGADIPLVSRILSVVDAFDSMVSSADYRLLTPKGAIVRIQQGAGTQFDPEVAAQAVKAFDKGVLYESRNPVTRPDERQRAA